MEILAFKGRFHFVETGEAASFLMCFFFPYANDWDKTEDSVTNFFISLLLEKKNLCHLLVRHALNVYGTVLCVADFFYIIHQQQLSRMLHFHDDTWISARAQTKARRQARMFDRISFV